MSLTATLIVNDTDRIERVGAHFYDSPHCGRCVIAAVEINGVTIQASDPGELARLASALIAAENKAEQLRVEHDLPTSVAFEPAVA